MNTHTYVGRTFVFRVDNGVAFRNTYAADGTTLHYETLQGPTKGASETVRLHTAALGAPASSWSAGSRSPA
ncbi:hypothetical protein [Streptomyces sp. NPDC001137]|uniref:MoaF-related domain-containing protein n=1 Tax=Streptomyces sp. NPDC001137 TaxID=3154378 RepID=UPI003316975D